MVNRESKTANQTVMYYNMYCRDSEPQLDQLGGVLGPQQTPAQQGKLPHLS